MIMQLHRAANERPKSLDEASGVDVRQVQGPKRVPSTRVLVSIAEDEAEEEADQDGDLLTSGYSFFDSVSCP